MAQHHCAVPKPCVALLWGYLGVGGSQVYHWVQLWVYMWEHTDGHWDQEQLLWVR